MKQLYHITRLLIFLFSMTLLSACTIMIGGEEPPPPIDPKDTKRALIFGYIDMDEAPDDLQRLSVERIWPEPYENYECGIEDGLFWHIGVNPGVYQIDTFRAEPGFFSRSIRRFPFDTGERNLSKRRATKPGVYFLGAYKFKAIKSDTEGEYKIVRLHSPNEKTLLKRLLDVIESDSDLNDYKHQIRWIKKRLKKLK